MKHSKYACLLLSAYIVSITGQTSCKSVKTTFQNAQCCANVEGSLLSTTLYTPLPAIFVGGRNWMDNTYSAEMIFLNGTNVKLVVGFSIPPATYRGIVQFMGGSIQSLTPMSLSSTIHMDWGRLANVDLSASFDLPEQSATDPTKFGSAFSYQDAFFNAFGTQVHTTADIDGRKVYPSECAPDGSFTAGYQVFSPSTTVSDFIPDVFKPEPNSNDACHIGYAVRETVFLLNKSKFMDPASSVDCFCEMKNVRLIGDCSGVTVSSTLQQLIDSTSNTTLVWVQFNTGDTFKEVFDLPVPL